MVKVATIINTHGLKGECKLYLSTDDVQSRFAKGNCLYLEDGKKLTVQSFRMQKGFAYVKFEEIQSIDEAEKFKQSILWIKESDLAPLEDGHYYYFELMNIQKLLRLDDFRFPLLRKHQFLNILLQLINSFF